MPELVDHIVVVDDTSQDATSEVLSSWPDPRLCAHRHTQNGGVGAAIVTGYRLALSLGADAVAVMAADAQMDPADLPSLLDALIDEDTDYVKGNRLAYPGAWQQMPTVRYVGTLALSLLTRLSSGYGELLDTQCGYTVARREALERLPLSSLYARYGFPNDILNQLGEIGAQVSQRPVRPVYADERSDLRPARVIAPISKLLARGLWRRLVAPGWQWRRGASGLSTLIGFMIGAVLLPEPADGARAPTPKRAARAVERIQSALKIIERHHVDAPERVALANHAVHGLVSELDRHCEYFETEDYQRWRARIRGRKIGPGFEVGADGDEVVITVVSPGSPAAKAGLVNGALLLSVNTEPARANTLDHVRKQLRGPSGSKMKLSWRAPDEPPNVQHDVELTRVEVQAVAVHAALLPGEVIHLKVDRYQAGVTRDVLRHYRRLIRERGRPPDGLIIDLRGNLGGLLREAILMADLFLPPGDLIVSLEGRDGALQRVHHAEHTERIEVPVVVLVDHLSASASELFAAALQDHERAVLVGTKTYGKGSVQSTYPLDDGSGLKITTSLYFSPSHQKIDDAGLTPDVLVPDV